MKRHACAFALGDVDETGPQQADGRRNSDKGHLAQSILPGGPADPSLIGDLLSGQGAFVVFRIGLHHRSRVRLLRRVEMLGSVFEDLAPRNAEQAFGGLVRGDEAVLVAVEEQDCVGRLLD